VLASEIEQLPDLQGFLKFASLPKWNPAALNRQESLHVRVPSTRRVTVQLGDARVEALLGSAHLRGKEVTKHGQSALGFGLGRLVL
jgi:hypothetical protein